jgi:hypothetical protein
MIRFLSKKGGVFGVSFIIFILGYLLPDKRLSSYLYEHSGENLKAFLYLYR